MNFRRMEFPHLRRKKPEVNSMKIIICFLLWGFGCVRAFPEEEITAIVDRLREEYPPAAKFESLNGRLYKNKAGEEVTLSFLSELSELFEDYSIDNVFLLFTYLRDEDSHIRMLAALVIWKKISEEDVTKKVPTIDVFCNKVDSEDYKKALQNICSSYVEVLVKK